MKTGIILLGHGSRRKSANQRLRELAQSIRDQGGWKLAEPAFLQFENPTLDESIAALVTGGAHKIIIIPFFLLEGNHVIKDLPQAVERQKEKYPGIEIVRSAVLGSSSRIIEIILDQIQKAVSQNAPHGN